MMLYPELPTPRSRMIAVDVGMLLVVIAMWIVAGVLHDAVAGLAQPAITVQETARDLTRDLSTPIDIPLVGDLLQVPLGALADGTRQLEMAAAQQVEGVERIARVVWLVAAIPAVLLLLAWLRHRLRWSRAAGAAAQARDAPGGLGVLATRAAVAAPLPAVMAVVGHDPLNLHDPVQRQNLAALELARFGLRPATRPSRAWSQ
ncbi:MAG TPA: hypothetical protein VMM13_17240 [Euzebya sp.]|nr:hypothetical protein [Euzebya sp.]